MNISFSALLACLSFYSGIYMIYYFFAKQQQPLIILIAIALLIFAWWITPHSYERDQKNYDSNLRMGNFSGIHSLHGGDFLFGQSVYYWLGFINKKIKGNIKKSTS